MKQDLTAEIGGLSWIRKDVDEKLKQARVGLEDFVDESLDELNDAIQALHQVRGALTVARIYGAAMVAGELERLATALNLGTIPEREAGATALMLGIVQLPAYLERVEQGEPDVPLALIPMLNDVRKAQKKPAVTRISLYGPRLDVELAEEQEEPGSGNPDLPALVRSQRVVFHRGLLNWMQDKDPAQGLRDMQGVIENIEDSAQTQPLRRLLEVTRVLLVSINEDGVKVPPALKVVFGRIDRVMKTILDQGEAGAARDIPQELLKHILYHIARADTHHPSVLELRDRYQLEDSFPEVSDVEQPSPELSGVDSDVFAAVGGAIKNDLDLITDRLDLYMRGDRTDLTRVTGLSEPLRRLADTLGMLNREDLRERLIPHADVVNACVEAEQAPDDNVLMELAGDLLAVESALMDLSEAVGRYDAGSASSGKDGAVSVGVISDAEYRQHVQATIDLVVLELARVKDALSLHIEGAEAATILDGLPDALNSLGGALLIIDQPRVSGLIKGLGEYIGSIAVDGKPEADSEEADALADLFGGIEYYLSYFLRPALGHDKALDTADQAMRRLIGRDSMPEMPQAPGDQTVFDELAGDSEIFPTDVEQAEAEPSQEAVVDSEMPLPDIEFIEVESSEEQIGESEVSLTEMESPETAPPSASEGASEDAIDDEIVEIFIEEAQEETETIQTEYPAWRENPGADGHLTQLRRSFHTLKGSGRLVGEDEIGEFAWSIENLLNRIIDGTVVVNDEVTGLFDEIVELLPELVGRIGRRGSEDPRVLALQERAFAIASGTAPVVAEPLVTESPPAEDVSSDLESGPAAIEETSIEETSAMHSKPETEPGLDDSSGLLLEEVIGERLSEVVAFPTGSRAGSGGLSNEGGSSVQLDETEPAGLEPQSTESTPESEIPVEAPTPPPIELEPTLFGIFSKEAEGHLRVLQDRLERCRKEPASCTHDEDLKRSLHTLRGSAHMAGVEPLAALAGALEKWTNLASDCGYPFDAEALELISHGHVMMQSLLEVINRIGAEMPAWDAVVDEVNDRILLIETQFRGHQVKDQPEQEAHDEELAEIFAEEARELIDLLESAYSAWESGSGSLDAVAELQRGLHTMKGGARLASLVTIGDLAHAIESLLEGVVEQRLILAADGMELVREALDVLGGYVDALEQQSMLQGQPELIARLEAAARGEQLPSPETQLRDVEAERSGAFSPDELQTEDVPGRDKPESEEPFEQATASQDAPEHETLDGLGEPEEPPEPEETSEPQPRQVLPDEELLAAAGLLEPSALVPGDGDLLSALGEDSRIIRFPEADTGEGAFEDTVHELPPEEEAEQPASKEQVRVAAILLDQLVNNAGEMSIYGARIEQQNKSLGHNLDELFQTIGRLRDQLRKLENETEAQILSGHELQHEGDLPDGFDPLEMDRYSMIQQLSRALSETTEDLNNIGSTLVELSRDTDTLLQQQSRVSNDLQDGLLRTRMVPVGTRAARLQRVVRQTAQTLGKKAELSLEGEQGEIDRAILDRMIGPLEHMLRNAVAHGIESTGERQAAGKPAIGRVTLEMGREGSEVILIVSDDGRGLDRQAIRRKAEEKGLIDPASDIDGEELDAFILEAGLSTSSDVSQVAGRGVGMDVVISEIKQLGGSIEIHSEPGKGARFMIRLPFTLAISEALLVGLGEETFVVPHGSLDGITRIARDELEACYRGEKENFDHAGHSYRVRYLGSMLGLEAVPQLPEDTRWLPVLLVRSGEHRIAIQVDRLLGNRQVVVKSVGTQLSGIRWFSGGTILADGSIALILDTTALVRMQAAHQTPIFQEQVESVPEGIRVMVVDDSITVRKVTSRLLERHNMGAVTARDGVDALALLQEERPDVVLLDIEMPRMDGFELARHMRSSDRLKDIPIIMITSRTGTKHRLHAVELGVSRYLGKPYQEAELLENIYSVLAEAGT